ncbi:MAG: hypothetical protein H0V44_03375 [Planctomycetes bacterium]|nr:hypothetical protein [Planctomycetota bacterium]
MIAVVVAMDAVALILVVVVGAIGGSGPGGLGPYLTAAAAHATGGAGLVSQVALIAAYGAALECVLRLGVQAPLTRAWSGAALPIVVAAAVQAATHLWCNTAGALAAFASSIVVGWSYAHGVRWWVLAAWHAQVGVLAVVATMLLAFMTPGIARTQALIAYKGGQIDAGRLVHITGWGWYDRTHADAWLYGQARDAIAAGSGHVDLTWYHRDLRGMHFIERSYDWQQAAVRGPEDAWAVCAGMVLDITSASERHQQDSPWWSAGPLSAWQFDDAPSTLYQCLSQAPSALAPPQLRMETDVGTLRERWLREGPTLVVTPHRDHALPEVADPTLQRLIDRIDAARAWWRVAPSPPSR